MARPGMPRKVLREASRLGVHADCVAAEPCMLCSPLIMQAFDTFYSHCENEHEMLVAVMEDFRRDILEEQQ